MQAFTVFLGKVEGLLSYWSIHLKDMPSKPDIPLKIFKVAHKLQKECEQGKRVSASAPTPENASGSKKEPCKHATKITCSLEKTVEYPAQVTANEMTPNRKRKGHAGRDPLAPRQNRYAAL
ncbi:hypothetical protein AAVH_12859 [Aphelenchoides avenae]|nr:hypothetical protein AAVH_12859 [Aphelenchus avenae]